MSVPTITLRDYFIAHAPAEPQPWFQPVMPHARPSVPDRFAIEDPGTQADVFSAWASDTDPETDGGIEWMNEYNEAIAAGNAWDAEQKKQRYVQWPAAWADEQLKLRGAAA
jgi:hypothetical protein